MSTNKNGMIRTKTCSICREKYRPTSSLQKVCSVFCAIEYTRKQAAKRDADKAKAERKETREKLEKLKTRSDYLKEAQQAFNSFIRVRDASQPCISCGTDGQGEALTGGYWDCGHYRSTGAAPHLRFIETNAAKQCKRCNRQLAGNVVAFRVGLVARHGLEVVEALESDNIMRRYTKEDLIEIRDSYRAEVRELKQGHVKTKKRH